MSRSLRQAKKLLKKAARHVRGISSYIESTYGTGPIFKDIGSEQIELTNGATITAVPCDPDTTVGETTNWLIDEFGLFPDSRTIYAVLKPSILHGKRMVIVSSPRGKDSKLADMYEAWTNGQSGWSWHKTTLQEAVADGMPIFDEHGNLTTFEKFRDAETLDIGEDLFDQEYMCVFSSEEMALIKWATIIRCQSDVIRPHKTMVQLAELGRDLFVGVDIGRRRDLSAIWILSRNGDEYTTEHVDVLADTPFPEQQAAIERIMHTGRVQSLRIDEQGIGMMLAEHFSACYPLTAQGVTFTNSTKLEIGGRVKAYMEAGNLWIPDDMETLRDIASVQRNVTESGTTTLTAKRTKHGHADRFWALGLALHAGCTSQALELAMAL